MSRVELPLRIQKFETAGCARPVAGFDKGRPALRRLDRRALSRDLAIEGLTGRQATLGVVPLVIASGASSATQHAIGTGVFGGMITGTFLAIIFVPVFYVVVVGGTDWLKARIAKLNLRLPKLSRKS